MLIVLTCDLVLIRLLVLSPKQCSLRKGDGLEYYCPSGFPLSPGRKRVSWLFQRKYPVWVTRRLMPWKRNASVWVPWDPAILSIFSLGWRVYIHLHLIFPLWQILYGIQLNLSQSSTTWEMSHWRKTHGAGRAISVTERLPAWLSMKKRNYIMHLFCALTYVLR